VSAESPSRTLERTASLCRASAYRIGSRQGSGHGADYVSVVFLTEAVTCRGAGEALNFIVVGDRLLSADHHDMTVHLLDSAGAA